jgi:hypothetical protein
MRAVPSGRAAGPDAASSVAPISLDIAALVSGEAASFIASERASHSDDERHSAKPSYRARMQTAHGVAPVLQACEHD